MDSSRTPGYLAGVYKPGLSGGLYTQASPISVPEGYSPAMENVFTNRRGNIRTRFGTQELVQLPTTSNAYLYTLRTRFNVTLLLVKQDQNLFIYMIQNVGVKELSLSLLTSFISIFSIEAKDAVPDFVFISDDSARIIIATGRNTPVIVKITERQIVNNTPLASLSLQNASEFSSSSLGELRLVKDGNLIPPSEYTFTGNQIVLPFAQTGTFDVLHLGWYWCTEASVKYGLQLSQTTSRFNTGASDLSTATPLDLLVGIRPMGSNNNKLPISLFKNGLASSPLTYVNPPLVENDFTFSGGSFRTTVNQQRVLPGITHVTFGALNPDETDISELTFIRGVDLTLFNAGILMPARNYSVFVDTSLSTLVYGTVDQDFGTAYNMLIESSDTGENPGIATDANALSTYVSFAATNSVGVPYPAVVRTIRTNPFRFGSGANRMIGTLATTGVDLPYSKAASGSWWPMYGLQEHADYFNGSFPSLLELHENRLVMSGFPGNPNRIVLSAVLDSTVKGDWYSDFQIQEQEGANVNAVLLDISTIDAGGITAVKSASGTLFAFTLNSVYLISGSEQGITPTAKFITQIAGVGAVNNNCVVVINNTIIFLSRSGIYALSQSFDAAGGWRVQLISEPINDKLISTTNTHTAWMTFLPNEDTLYVAVSETDEPVANELYFWKQDINSWSRFTDYTGYWDSVSGKFVDLSENYMLMSRHGTIVSYPYRYTLDQFKGEPNVTRFTDMVLGDVITLPFKFIPDVGISDVKIVGDYKLTKLNDSQVVLAGDGVPAGGYLYPSGINCATVLVYTQDGTLRDIIYDTELGFSSEPEPTDIVGYVYKSYATTSNLFVSSTQGTAGYLPSVKSVHTSYFIFHTNGDYLNFGVSIKKVDTDPIQLTPLNTFPVVDPGTIVAFDKALMDAAIYLVRPFWKVAIHPGGVEDFYQMIVLSDSTSAWELISLQTTLSQSSVRPGTGRT